MSSILSGKSSEAWWRRQDWVLTAASLALSFMGTLVIWAATRPRLLSQGVDPEAYLKRHVAVLIIGLILGILVARTRYPILRAYVPVLWLFSVVTLVLVLVLGKDINGVRAWFALPGGFTLQPSEFAKLAIVIGMAIVLAETPHRDGIPSNREVIFGLGVAGLPVALIMLQPDLGTVLVIGAVTMAVLSISGAASRWLLGLGGSAVIAGWAMVQFGILDQYQLDRLLVFLNPELDPQDSGYNILQVRLAIGSGGLSGTGLFNGPQTNGQWVPEQQTDFIFSAVGEELGFIGGATIITLLFIVCWRAFKIAAETTDRFGKIAASGVAAWIAFQAFENIGMNIGIMPITGVPLPFISYGGSSIFAIWMAVGLLQNIKIKHSD